MKRIKEMLLIVVLMLCGSVSALASSSIVVSCSGVRKGNNAVFRVFDSGDRLVCTVVLEGKGPGVAVSRKIVGLAPGTYRVEDSNWACGYESQERSLSGIVEDNSVRTFSFRLSRRPDATRCLEDEEVNVFNM